MSFETKMQQVDGGIWREPRKLHGVQIAAITENSRYGLRTLDPDHPHAGEDRMVENSNVSLPKADGKSNERYEK